MIQKHCMLNLNHTYVEWSSVCDFVSNYVKTAAPIVFGFCLWWLICTKFKSSFLFFKYLTNCVPYHRYSWKNVCRQDEIQRYSWFSWDNMISTKWLLLNINLFDERCQRIVKQWHLVPSFHSSWNTKQRCTLSHFMHEKNTHRAHSAVEHD